MTFGDVGFLSPSTLRLSKYHCSKSKIENDHSKIQLLAFFKKGYNMNGNHTGNYEFLFCTEHLTCSTVVARGGFEEQCYSGLGHSDRMKTYNVIQEIIGS